MSHVFATVRQPLCYTWEQQGQAYTIMRKIAQQKTMNGVNVIQFHTTLKI